MEETFILWVSKTSPLKANISWLEEFGCPIDAAISSAQIEIDGRGDVTGFMLQTKLTL